MEVQRMNSFDLTGKTALVTGGSSGIGLGMAEGLLEAGTKVVITGSSAKVAARTEELKAKGFHVWGVTADLAKGESEAKRLIEEAIRILDGRLDILINSAGTSKVGKPEQFPIEDWDTVMNLNLRSMFLMCREAGIHMLKQGGGRIINIASMLSFFGGVDTPAYATSKGGVAQMTKALSNSWASKGINVNAVAPGFIETALSAMRREKDPAFYETVCQRIPAGRWGMPDDLKGIAVFLSSDASRYITGCVIPVDGGYLVC